MLRIIIWKVECPWEEGREKNENRETRKWWQAWCWVKLIEQLPQTFTHFPTHILCPHLHHWHGTETAHVGSKDWSQNSLYEVNFLQTCGNLGKSFATGHGRVCGEGKGVMLIQVWPASYCYKVLPSFPVDIGNYQLSLYFVAFKTQIQILLLQENFSSSFLLDHHPTLGRAKLLSTPYTTKIVLDGKERWSISSSYTYDLPLANNKGGANLHFGPHLPPLPLQSS